MENKPGHIHRIAIKAKPEQVWQAITDPAKTSKFWFNCAIQASWEVGSPFELWNGEEKKAEGTILEITPPRKLVMSWRFISFTGTGNDMTSRITWEIDSHGELQGVSLVTVIHDEFEQAPGTAKILENGLLIVISGLKTLLETGEMLGSVFKA
ncbi:SRPBCC domain-containing protein [Paenibacillus macerans]|uniref:SRPBCC domain-containing protein n=1 Tax=Paenibacillus macerans TaxID=44252 RepID=UPI00203CA7A8|nr:SRPBCC domain-containing protein [Paenibacillus macerans]MCM3700782.1 SRPBCC domain-containing protein [Paenibacillus macerans]